MGAAECWCGKDLRLTAQEFDFDGLNFRPAGANGDYRRTVTAETFAFDERFVNRSSVGQFRFDHRTDGFNDIR